MLARERVFDQLLHGKAAADREHVVAHAVGRGMEDAPCCSVDAQHRAGLAQKHKSLVHAAGDGVKLVALALELLAVGRNLPVLLLDACEKRRKLLVDGNFQRPVEIHGVERHDDAYRYLPRQHGRQNDGLLERLLRQRC